MSKHKIFVIEDNKTETIIFKLAFSGLANVDVTYFDTGTKLLENLDQQPSLIIMDMMLPDIHGLELIKKVRSSGITTDLIVVSAQEDVDMIAQVQAEGVFNYIVKSESALSYLKMVIENLLALRTVKPLEGSSQ